MFERGKPQQIKVNEKGPYHMVCSDFILMKTSVFQIIQPIYWAWKLTSELHCGLNFPVFDVQWSFQPRKDFPRITDSFRRYDHWNFSNCGFLCGIFSVMFGQRKMTSKVNSNMFYRKGTSQTQPFFKDMIPIIGEKKLIIDIFVGYFLKISIER